MKNLKKIITIGIVALFLVFSACSKKDGGSSGPIPTFDQLKLGQDYTGIKANLRFKTHRTDIMDTIFLGYIKDFQKMYPNVTISYEGVTDYAEGMTTSGLYPKQ